ncbi:MAG: hypothetical protein KGL39_60400 [Patescibacteria group bacterium]|nr:hypothetical protein [Patescibacteria group bacterium]
MTEHKDDTERKLPAPPRSPLVWQLECPHQGETIADQITRRFIAGDRTECPVLLHYAVQHGGLGEHLRTLPREEADIYWHAAMSCQDGCIVCQEKAFVDLLKWVLRAGGRANDCERPLIGALSTTIRDYEEDVKSALRVGRGCLCAECVRNGYVYDGEGDGEGDGEDDGEGDGEGDGDVDEDGCWRPPFCHREDKVGGIAAELSSYVSIIRQVVAMAKYWRTAYPKHLVMSKLVRGPSIDDPHAPTIVGRLPIRRVAMSNRDFEAKMQAPAKMPRRPTPPPEQLREEYMIARELSAPWYTRHAYHD